MPEKKRRKKTISFAPAGSNALHDKADEYFARIKSGDKTDVVAAALIMFFEQNTYYRGNGNQKVTVLPVGNRDVVVKPSTDCLYEGDYTKAREKEMGFHATIPEASSVQEWREKEEALAMAQEEKVPDSEHSADDVDFSDEDLALLVGGWDKQK